MSADVQNMLRFLGWLILLGLTVLMVGKIMGQVQGRAASFTKG